MPRTTHRLAFAAALGLAAGLVQAQAPYPSKPIRVLVGYTAGGPADGQARTFARFVEPIIGQQIVIENRVGNGGAIASQAAAAAAPDGYTLISGGSTTASDVFIKSGVTDWFRALAPIRQVTESRVMLFASAKLPVTTVQELIAFAKRNPGRKFTHGSVGASSPMLMEIVKIATGIDYIDVPHKGAAAILPGLVNGEIDLVITTPTPYFGAIQAGQIRVLMVGQPNRSELFPTAQTGREAGVPTLEAVAYPGGWWAPAATPRAIIERLNNDMGRAIANPEAVEALRRIGSGAVQQSSPELFRKAAQADYDFWKEAARRVNYQPQ